MGKSLNISRGSKRTQKKFAPQKRVAPHVDVSNVGNIVQLIHEGQRLICVVTKEKSDQEHTIEIALPDRDGILHKTGSLLVVKAEDLSDINDVVLSDTDVLVKAWDANLEAGILKDKQPRSIHLDDDEEKPIIDFLDVKIEGFLSTFVNVTPSDRDGDYVESSAFDETLVEFRRNPVMLTDHSSRVSSLAGSFTKIGVNQTGLAVSALLSNAPDVISTRFKVAEGHLKTLSMGGLFFYKEDGRGIEKVDLFEGSLVTVPANQDALFQVRSLTALDASKAYRRFTSKSSLKSVA